MGLLARNLLQDPEEVDGGLELAEGEICYGRCGKGGEGVAEFVDGGVGELFRGGEVVRIGRVDLFRRGEVFE